MALNFPRQNSVSPDLHILIPEIQYLTNDVWELTSGMTQNDPGYPLLLQAGYGSGEQLSGKAGGAGMGGFGFGGGGGNRANFAVKIKPHSYRVFGIIP